MNYFANPYVGHPFGATVFPVLALLAVWTLFWKGTALWHAARRGQGWWFLVLLLLNTMGILEIIYLFGVAKIKADQLIPKK